MVSTRGHPRDFPQPETSPAKPSPRKSLRRSTRSPSRAQEDTPSASPSRDLMTASAPTLPSYSSQLDSLSRTSATTREAVSVSIPGWSHTASNITIAWLMVSVPLQIWDTLYILLRPHTMAGGKLQWPLWKPYEIYAAIDHVYGWPGWNNNDGFGGAQGALNLVETVLYGLYIMIIVNHGVPSARGKGVQVGEGARGWLSGGRRVQGKRGNRALLIGFAAAVMTLSKTVMYMLNEYFSGFENIKHNDWPTLITFYIVMNGLWIVFPTYMTIVFGSDILEGLDLIAVEPVAKPPRKKRN
ncbi:uncharacterized protein EI97DRAFT_401186 [Westerdykella ornata]|uniref:EBP-domain-containing protein n=1 Tax=Westerdykella ornata TaxID=318751 RepID=A0A6A6JEW6_WESOR|nr:uncharacterized protein EI97DRAFT_401186 [Westerdykella ornata]KAF2275101.1 hypothetical protein EI97DRAFT_401186 [Westerdykella ornata]